MDTDFKIKSSLKSTRILVLEDDQIMLTLLRDVLNVMGFGEIVIAKQGELALQEIKKSNFDLIFCDWRMRGMDGLEFTKVVRAIPDPAKCFTPIIMLTGYAKEEDVKTARDAGVTEYMVKPFSIKSLCTKIKSIVENPRQFVINNTFKGPDRRRKEDPTKVPDGINRRQQEIKKL